jgi:hypothetical protein
MPGAYQVRLKVGNETYTQPIYVRMDPRVKTPRAGLQEQFDLSMKAYKARKQCLDAIRDIAQSRKILTDFNPGPTVNPGMDKSIKDLDAQAAALAGTARRGRRPGGDQGTPSFSQLEGTLGSLLTMLEEADLPPTSQAAAGLASTLGQTAQALKEWNGLQKKFGDILQHRREP